MEPQLISKILRITAPDSDVMDLEHPLLDPAACRALGAGLVRLLRISSTAAPRARLAVLRNIRSLTAPPAHHHSADIVPVLIQHYAKIAVREPEHACESCEDEMSIFLSSQLDTVNFENQPDHSKIKLARALLNKDPENPYIKYELRKALSCNVYDKQTMKLLIDFWENEKSLDKNLIDTFSVAMKCEIERTLLSAAINIITDTEKIPETMECKPMRNLVIKSSKSPNCFQLCCRILAAIFTYSKFNLKIQLLTQLFVESIKLISRNFITLYDDEVQSLVMLLNCEEIIGTESALVYVKQLQHLRTKSEEKFIMLMSHFPRWFDYMNQTYNK